MAVASAGPYASLHLAPDRKPRQHLTTQVFTDQMPFLPPNQQCQSTEGQRSINQSVNFIFSPHALRETEARWIYVLLMFYLKKNIFSDFCRANYLNIYLHEICRICRTLTVDERSSYFFDLSRDVAVATNFVGKIDLQYTPCSSHDIR